MELNKYQELASRTQPAGGKNHWFLGESHHVDLIHASLGLLTEVGELADPIKKAMMYGKPIDYKNIREEAGDCLWYLALLCRALGCTLEELADENIKKLQERYPARYTDADAIERKDKAGE